MGSIGDAVLAEGDGERTERVGLDDLAAHLEIGGVELADDVGAGHGEQFVAALEVLAAEVVGGETAELDAGTHAAVEDHDALARCIEETVRAAHGGDSWLGRSDADASHALNKMGGWRSVADRWGALALPIRTASADLRLAEGICSSTGRWRSGRGRRVGSAP